MRLGDIGDNLERASMSLDEALALLDEIIRDHKTSDAVRELVERAQYKASDAKRLVDWSRD